MVSTPQSPSKQYIKAYATRTLLQRVDDLSVLTIEKAAFMLDPGIKIEVQKAISPDGRLKPVDQYGTEEAATLELDLQAAPTNVQTTELIFGRRFASASKNTYVGFDLIVPASGEVPAKTEGKYGFGATADTAFASVLGTDGLDLQLNREASAGADLSESTISFAQSANCALVFSPDLIGKSVNILIPLTAQTIVGLTNTLTGFYRIISQVIKTDGRIGTFSCELAKQDFSAKWDPASKSVKIKFNIFEESGADRAFELDWIDGTR